MKQRGLFNNVPSQNDDTKSIGNRLYFIFLDKNETKIALYKYETLIKTVDLSDKLAKKMLIIEAVELGAKKSLVAKALGISRQTVHTYIDTKKLFGIEGLMASYAPERSKNLRKHREENTSKRPTGNTARKIEEIRKKDKKKELKQVEIPFGDQSHNIAPENQPFASQHDWKPSRFAGVFTYLITLIHSNDWLQMIMSYFGDKYKIFMPLLLMAAKNIRSIEQIKNIPKREAGLILGIQQLPTKLNVRVLLHAACQKGIAIHLLGNYFRRQVLSGIVGTWLWFIDGHLLPYTGKKKVHKAYNTQRRLMVPGRVNQVVCDISGRVVDFEIQEGKGDLRTYILKLAEKWKNEIPEGPVMVFDREG